VWGAGGRPPGPPRRPDRRHVVGVDQAEEVLGRTGNLARLNAEDVKHLVRPPQPVGVELLLPVAEVGDPLRPGQARLAPPQRLLDPLAVGNVADHGQEVVAVQADVGDAHLDRKRRAVLAPVETFDDA
jgi:hypothetical protein